MHVRRTGSTSRPPDSSPRVAGPSRQVVRLCVTARRPRCSRCTGALRPITQTITNSIRHRLQGDCSPFHTQNHHRAQARRGPPAAWRLLPTAARAALGWSTAPRAPLPLSAKPQRQHSGRWASLITLPAASKKRNDCVSQRPLLGT